MVYGVGSYHTGSLAFGSLILSLVQMVRVVLEYLDSKLKGRLEHFELAILPVVHNLSDYFRLDVDQ